MQNQLCGFYKCRESEAGLMEYYILKNVKDFDGMSVDVYGIELRKAEDVCSVRDISSDQSIVQEILDKLIRNAVTPVSLKDIILDMI